MTEHAKKFHHGDLRAALLEAVRDLVEQHGPDGFTLAQACRRAGVSTAAPYKHFSDRHEILRAVVLAGMQRLEAAMRAATERYPAGDPRRVVELGRSYIDFARAEPGVFRLMFGMGEGEDDALAEAGERANRLVEQVVADHFGISVDTPEVRLRAYALWCFVHGHSFLIMDAKLPESAAALDENHLLVFVGNTVLPPTQSAQHQW